MANPPVKLDTTVRRAKRGPNNHLGGRIVQRPAGKSGPVLSDRKGSAK